MWIFWGGMGEGAIFKLTDGRKRRENLCKEAEASPESHH